MRRKILPLLCGGAVTALMLLSTGVASAASRDVCKGTAENPGVLVGFHVGDVLVEGVCAMPAGPAEVHGTLTLGDGSALVAAFGGNGSRLTVDGSIRVERGATMLLGCDPQSFACVDDPNKMNPTLSSAPVVGGSIVAQGALGVIVHNAKIGGSVWQSGGGGGVRCDVIGIFKKAMSPVYSAYEDSTVAGGITIRDMHTCWLGITRTNVGKSVRLVDDHLADPDGIEVLSNHIRDDLACFGNTQHLWDSSEASFGTKLYPRVPHPNSVEGKRLGQCVLASPPTDSSPPGPGPF